MMGTILEVTRIRTIVFWGLYWVFWETTIIVIATPIVHSVSVAFDIAKNQLVHFLQQG